MTLRWLDQKITGGKKKKKKSRGWERFRGTSKKRLDYKRKSSRDEKKGGKTLPFFSAQM